jgi:hypothetical protein
MESARHEISANTAPLASFFFIVLPVIIIVIVFVNLITSYPPWRPVYARRQAAFLFRLAASARPFASRADNAYGTVMLSLAATYTG